VTVDIFVDKEYVEMLADIEALHKSLYTKIMLSHSGKEAIWNFPLVRYCLTILRFSETFYIPC